jgi:uncharacterized protein (TIGR02646 family)
MIRIHRPARAPAILTTKGKQARRRHVTEYRAAPADYASGKKTFSFDRDIYAHDSVKRALCRAQHNKCCFCESKVTHVAYGDVEHFRPKAAFAQAHGVPLTRPGYYWLAYEWTNLLFCCQLCNQRHKRWLFPLQDPSRRARSPRHRLAREQPLFIDPSTVDPALHLEFHEDGVRAVRGSLTGKTTIDALQLNREDLAESRKDRLRMLEAIRRTRDYLARRVATGKAFAEEKALLKEHDALLTDCQHDSAPYAAMARAFLAS